MFIRAPSSKELKLEAWGSYFAMVVLALLSRKKKKRVFLCFGNLNLSVESEFLPAKGI